MPREPNLCAKWLDTQRRWQINVSANGIRRSFYSSAPSNRGRSEAEYKAREWLKNQNNSTITFEKAWLSFYESKKAKRSTATAKQLDYIYRQWLRPNIKKSKLFSITPQDWQDIVDKAYRNGLSKKSCKNIRGVITNFYTFCQMNCWEMHKPCGIEIPDDASVEEKAILQPDEFKCLFSEDSITTKGKKQFCFYIHCWRFIAVTGLRRGEAVGLKFSDINGDKLRISRSVNSFNEITAGKNKNANREIPLSQIALAVLEDQRAMLEEYGILGEWVFPSPDGDRADSNSVYRHWRTYRKHHNIKCNIHGLRHTTISYLKNYVPKETLKRFVGYSATTDTLGIYCHAVDGELEEAAEIIDEVFGRHLKV